jgi:outer membrane lipoprotein SlyB
MLLFIACRETIIIHTQEIYYMLNRHLTHIIIALSALSLTACSSVPKIPYHSVDARVIKSSYAPEICRYKDSGGNIIGSAAIGGAIGGLAGNQFGSGKGKAIMTVLGVVTGVSVGISTSKKDKSKLVCKSDGYVATLMYSHPVSGSVITVNRAFYKRPRHNMINILVR